MRQIEKVKLEEQVGCSYVLCMRTIKPGIRLRDEKGKLYCSDACLARQANFLHMAVKAEPVEIRYR